MTVNGFTLRQLLVVLLFFALVACSDLDSQPTGDQKDFSTTFLAESKMMQFFAANHPGLTILKFAKADLDNDHRDDLIVIYQIKSNTNEMSVVHHQKGNFKETNAVPAPVSDQVIQFRNIDEKPPLEFILQGRKGAKVGYAIFRVEDGKLTDLFGEGMEDCC